MGDPGQPSHTTVADQDLDIFFEKNTRAECLERRSKCHKKNFLDLLYAKKKRLQQRQEQRNQRYTEGTSHLEIDAKVLEANIKQLEKKVNSVQRTDPVVTKSDFFKSEFKERSLQRKQLRRHCKKRILYPRTPTSRIYSRYQTLRVVQEKIKCLPDKPKRLVFTSISTPLTSSEPLPLDSDLASCQQDEDTQISQVSQNSLSQIDPSHLVDPQNCNVDSKTQSSYFDSLVSPKPKWESETWWRSTKTEL